MACSTSCATSASRSSRSPRSRQTQPLHQPSRTRGLESRKGTDMTNTTHPKVPMDTTRKLALVAGVLYLVTFVGSIPALPLYHHILHNPNYLLGHASDTGVLWGAIG